MTNENKHNIYVRCACIAAVAIFMFFFATIIVRTLTRQILVKKLGMENSFTNIVLFDLKNLNNTDEDTGNATVKIDWQSLYPFETGRQSVPDKAVTTTGFADKYKERILSVEEKIETYVTDYLIWYKKIVELANKYKSIIQWDYASYAEYNGIVKLPDGHLTSYIEQRDTNSAADNMISFADYCKQNGINFIYIQAPYKISRIQDKGVSGVVDFSNQNADALIQRLKQANVDIYDLRDEIESEGLNHHSLFFRTDHHWLPETGLWASRHILDYLNQKYKYNTDSGALNESQFKIVLYPKWFLGSQGKKVTLAVTTPDDFSLLYPTYKTQMHFSIPDAEIDLDGDFSIVYDMKKVEKIDYYGRNPYGAYMYSDHALTRFENHLSKNNMRLLFIHDSFGDCVLPFVSIGVKYVDSLDLRHFTGSVMSFIEKNKPDAVIVLYNPNSIKSDGDLHKAPFDFR